GPQRTAPEQENGDADGQNREQRRARKATTEETTILDRRGVNGRILLDRSIHGRPEPTAIRVPAKKAEKDESRAQSASCPRLENHGRRNCGAISYAVGAMNCAVGSRKHDSRLKSHARGRGFDSPATGRLSRR